MGPRLKHARERFGKLTLLAAVACGSDSAYAHGQEYIVPVGLWLALLIAAIMGLIFWRVSWKWKLLAVALSLVIWYGVGNLLYEMLDCYRHQESVICNYLEALSLLVGCAGAYVTCERIRRSKGEAKREAAG